MPASLGGRLLLGSAVFTALALVFTLFVMQHVLHRFVTGQIDQRLDNKIVELASRVEVDAGGKIRLRGDADGPPFDKPRHKAFWWIGGPQNELKTGWLHDGDITPPSPTEIASLPTPPVPPRAEPEDLDDRELPLRERPRTFDDVQLGVPMHMRVARRTIGTSQLTILAAAPQEAISHPMRDAMTTIGLSMAALGAALVLAAFVQVRLGLRPLARLRDAVAVVRDGTRSELPTDQPREIKPLVTELNSLLVQNAANLDRARKHVANLAHGLKTPLATLSLAFARRGGEDATELRTLVDLIERRVRHHLGRARAAALDGPVRVRTILAPRLADITDALQKIHADKKVALSLTCPDGLAVSCEAQDIDEMLGNLLDNAFKYTASRVECDVRTEVGSVVIAIADDGPGLTREEIGRVQRPGQRLDEEVPGHGFGLPIARELAELYGGKVMMAPREVGLIVRLILPRAI